MASFCYGVNKQCVSFCYLCECLNLLAFAHFSKMVVFSTTMTLLAVCWTLFLWMFGSTFLILMTRQQLVLVWRLSFAISLG